MPSSPTDDAVADDEYPCVTDKTYRYRVWMYLALVAWMSFIWWRVERNENARQDKDRAIIAQVEAEARARIEDVEQEALQRDYTVCLRGNEVRSGFRNYIANIEREFGPSETVDRLVAQAALDFQNVPCPPPPPIKEKEEPGG
jgi:hypothetical protein